MGSLCGGGRENGEAERCGLCRGKYLTALQIRSEKPLYMRSPLGFFFFFPSSSFNVFLFFLNSVLHFVSLRLYATRGFSISFFLSSSRPIFSVCFSFSTPSLCFILFFSLSGSSWERVHGSSVFPPSNPPPPPFFSDWATSSGFLCFWRPLTLRGSRRGTMGLEAHDFTLSDVVQTTLRSTLRHYQYQPKQLSVFISSYRLFIGFLHLIRGLGGKSFPFHSSSFQQIIHRNCILNKQLLNLAPSIYYH